MARGPIAETSVERLARYLFDILPGAGPRSGAGLGSDVAPATNGPDPVDVSFGREMAAWLAESRRFRDFAEANRDKIRKKLRGAADSEARRDVRAELLTARRLLADKRIELAFEAYGSGRGGPDFTVAFHGERGFDLEVTRLRRTPDVAAFSGVLLGKLRQLSPSVPNVLLIAIDDVAPNAAGIEEAARALRARADRKDEAFFVDRGLAGTRWFYERFARLSLVFVAGEAGEGDERASIWVNRIARIPLPPRAARGCLASLQAD